MPSLPKLLETTYEALTLWSVSLLCALVLVPVRRARSGIACTVAYGTCAVLYIRSAERGAEQLALYGVAIVYFSALGVALHRYAVRLAKLTTKPALLLICMLSFLLLPALTWPHALGALFLPFAWEIALSAYSYCVESGARREDPTLRACLFFLLVDPTLVFLPEERARQSLRPRRRWPATLRMVWGAGLAGPASLLFYERHRAALFIVERTGESSAVLVQGFVLFVAFYAAHAALASYRIGFLRLLGYEVAERYDRPMLALSPLDFWRRWNTYVGAWSRYYVFFPTVATLRVRPATRALASYLALPVTMLSVGALHDLYVYAASMRAAPTFTGYFGVAALVMIVWTACAERAARLPAIRETIAHRVGVGTVRRVGLVCTASIVWLCFGWLEP